MRSYKLRKDEQNAVATKAAPIASQVPENTSAHVEDNPRDCNEVEDLVTCDKNSVDKAATIPKRKKQRKEDAARKEEVVDVSVTTAALASPNLCEIFGL